MSADTNMTATSPMYSMTLDEARAELHRYVQECETCTSIAARLVLEEAKRLRQLLCDLVDHDVGEVPELDALDALDAAEGSQQIERHDRVWKAAITEVGARTPRRYVGDAS